MDILQPKHSKWRKKQADYLRKVRKVCSCSACEKEIIEQEIKLLPNALWVIGSIFIAGLIIIIFCIFSKPVHAEEYSDTQIANAIFKAEGGLKTKHPYGILSTYKSTTPRQACLNTIKHKRKQWVANGSKGSFIAFLGKRYCPIGALNDPTRLNNNWIKNVNYFLSKEIK